MTCTIDRRKGEIGDAMGNWVWLGPDIKVLTMAVKIPALVIPLQNIINATFSQPRKRSLLAQRIVQKKQEKKKAGGGEGADKR